MMRRSVTVAEVRGGMRTGRGWEGCLACTHPLTAHAQPRGPCQVARCGCRGFDWADEGHVAGSFRLCLRWLWQAPEAGPGNAVTASDRRAALAALGALTDLLGPAHAARILVEERERWRLETGSLPETRDLVRAAGLPPDQVRGA
jgi:hypothetical protein